MDEYERKLKQKLKLNAYDIYGLSEILDRE